MQPHVPESAVGQTPLGRGPFCPHCNMFLPVFADLTVTQEQRIRSLLLQGRHLIARAELISTTGCSNPLAGIWLEHGGRPKPIPGATPPCPYCGKPLWTSLSKQCCYCHVNWHATTGWEPARLIVFAAECGKIHCAFIHNVDFRASAALEWKKPHEQTNDGEAGRDGGADPNL